MSMTKMNIPKTIRVGYQNRQGTYTGKLAYIIWIDEKGKVRKEVSWNSWRNKEIDPEDFVNEPMSGFVLNKGVGGARASSSWNPRNEYIRVYDPRGFEFEISVANLLFILQETSSIKGKGLEGEFVYAWDGKDLVLLPTCSEEYKACSIFTKHQSGRVTKKDMVEGHSYLLKDMKKVMYLGRHEYYEPATSWRNGKHVKHKGKKHIFIELNKVGQIKNDYEPYITLPGFVKIAEKLSDEVPSEFANEYTEFINSVYNQSIIDLRITKKELNKNRLKNYYNKHALIKEDNNYYFIRINKIHHGEYQGMYQISKVDEPYLPVLVGNKCSDFPDFKEWYTGNYYSLNRQRMKNFTNEKGITEEDLFSRDFYMIELVNAKGGTLSVFHDY